MILHRLDTQAMRNFNVQKAEIDSKLAVEKKDINKLLDKSKKEVEGE